MAFRSPRAPDAGQAKAPVTALKMLWPFVMRQRGLFAAWLIALALSSVATLSLPVAVRGMIDQGFADPARIDATFAVLLLVAVALALFTAARFFFVSLLGERVVADLRTRLYAHLLDLDQAFFERNRSGDLVSRLSADTELLRSVVGSTMSVALRSTVMVLGSMAMLVVTSPRLAAFTLIGIPLFVLPLVLGGRRLEKISRQSQDRIADANALANETLGAIRTVQAHAREPYERDRFGGAVAVSVATARRRIGLQAIITAVAITLIFGAVTAVLWSGAHDVISGDMTAGTLGQFVLYALFGAGSVGALAEVWNELQRAAGGMGRISELLVETPGIRGPSQPGTALAKARGSLAFEDVTFHYPTRPDSPALDGFTLHVAPGETVALVGPSGAGKSTVLSLLLRFHDPEQGAVAIDGIDLRSLPPDEVRAQIALVAQQPTIFATTARDNIRYGRLDASDAEVEAAARAAEAHAFLAALPEGYDAQLGERGARLSGGQQQRIAIARALLRDAPILLLDEATSALDAQSEHAVQQALARLMEGRTTLVIAHRLATVLKADRIVVMDAGRIIAQGTHAELIAQGGLYAELARLQFID
ncbi:ABC transporter transmembrane domain-containing protein [Luteimonas sp BLCC-B24]|uniref:ABC transporter transmembrane domain-containing protein n=1 Tax=Luteimonas sp. BLCC-B24 TaxID=3025317 RepID=UPI00234E12A4|nr:ABC transporter transmembrane domain-containing protein [Luteimonas sp. BLCC-B24]MDC7808046.1 ABC transporter transmembrane domain-containing protein [Luteimonas sp. BLCC-B24]